MAQSLHLNLWLSVMIPQNKAVFNKNKKELVIENLCLYNSHFFSISNRNVEDVVDITKFQPRSSISETSYKRKKGNLNKNPKAWLYALLDNSI